MKCLINLFFDAQLNFEEWNHAKDYSCSVAEIAKLWQTKKFGFHVEILNPKSFSCPAAKWPRHILQDEASK